MKKCLFLCICGLLFLACQNNTDQTVSDKEKKEIQQLDSLVNDLAKHKTKEPAQVPEPSIPKHK